MRYDVCFIATGLACLLAGLGVGFWFMTPMGGNLALLPTHAHFNLFGGVTLSLYGLLHKAYPKLGAGALAKVQFWLAVAGGVGLPIGFAIARANPAHNLLIGLGAISGATAAMLFAFTFGARVIFEPRA
jgi:hypothetical protein